PMVMVVVGPLGLDPQPVPAPAVRGSKSEAIEIRSEGELGMWAPGGALTTGGQSEATGRSTDRVAALSPSPRAPRGRTGAAASVSRGQLGAGRPLGAVVDLL